MTIEKILRSQIVITVATFCQYVKFTKKSGSLISELQVARSLNIPCCTLEMVSVTAIRVFSANQYCYCTETTMLLANRYFLRLIISQCRTLNELVLLRLIDVVFLEFPSLFAIVRQK